MKTGACACGAVRFEVTGQPTKVTCCHDSKCRRWRDTSARDGLLRFDELP